MSLNRRRKQSFTLFEICVSICLLIMLTTSVAFMGYDTLKEFRKSNGKREFVDYITTLHHKNCLKEEQVLLLVKMKNNTIETSLGGNTTSFGVHKSAKKFYVGNLFKDGATYTIEITNKPMPTTKNIAFWIEKHNTINKFYEAVSH